MNEIVPYEKSPKEELFNCISTQTFDVGKYKKQLDVKGKEVYKKKINMKELSDIMSDEHFQSFFDKNFQTWDDVRSIVTLMMAFRQIDKYTEDKKLNKYQKLALLEMILSNSKTRSFIYKYFTNQNLRLD